MFIFEDRFFSSYEFDVLGFPFVGANKSWKFIATGILRPLVAHYICWKLDFLLKLGTTLGMGEPELHSNQYKVCARKWQRNSFLRTMLNRSRLTLAWDHFLIVWHSKIIIFSQHPILSKWYNYNPTPLTLSTIIFILMDYFHILDILSYYFFLFTLFKIPFILSGNLSFALKVFKEEDVSSLFNTLNKAINQLWYIV